MKNRYTTPAKILLSIIKKNLRISARLEKNATIFINNIFFITNVLKNPKIFI